MSRARLFKRAADWLKTCIKTKEQAEEQKDRRRAFQFAFGQLEERVVLDADFGWNGAVVDLNNFTSLGGEALSVGDTGTHFEFTLAEGTWDGTDTGFITGMGSPVLSVSKATPGLTAIASDAPGINTNFAAVDFDSAATLASIDFTGGDITQTGAITADGIASFFAGDLINLKTQSNDFGFVDVDGTDVFVDDTDEIVVDAMSSTNVKIDSGGDIDVLSAVFASNLRLNSHANGGTGGNILIENAKGTNLIVDAGTGDIDATHAGNDFTAIIVDGADNADFVDPNSVNLRGITANSVSVDAGDDIRIQKHITAADVFLDTDDLINQIGEQITADRLTVKSASNTWLTQSTNAIGALSADVGGDLSLMNTTHLDIASLTFTFGDGSTSTTTGADVTGNVDIEMIDLDLVSVEPLTVGGHFSLALGTGCASLTNTGNDFQSIEVLSADQVDIIDFTGLSIDSATVGTSLYVGSLLDIEINGDITAGDKVGFQAANINQNAGIISALGLLVETTADANLGSANEIGTAVVPGLLSANVIGNFVLNNVYGLDIETQTFSSKSIFFVVSGVDVDGDACLHADSFVFNSFFDAANLAIESNNGLSISDVTFNDLIVSGTGDFTIGGTNAINRFAADVDGNLSLANSVDIEIADLNLCGVQVIGVMTTGDWDVFLSDDNITDSAESIVGGKTTFDIGTGDGTLDHANNDFSQIEIVSSNLFTINDVSDFDVMAANGTELVFNTNTGSRLHGDITATDAVTFTSNVSGGVDQVAGIIDTDHLSLFGIGDFTLNGLNQIRQDAVSSIVTEVEPNNSLGAAQNVDDGNFVLDFDPDITDSTTIPHISVEGTGDGTFDFYSFTVSGAGQVGNFDIDYNDFDSELFLFDSAGDLLAFNDDSFNPGSGGFASFISHTFASAGTYYIGVGRFDSTSTGGGIITGNTPDPGDNYTLHISLEGKQISFPAGQLTVDTTGNVSINNDQGIEFTGTASVDGDLMVTTTDDDIKQESGTPVTVTGTSTFYAGTGDVCLEDVSNDFGTVNVNAAFAEIVDANGMTVNDATMSDRIVLEAIGGDLTLTGDIVSPNGLLLLAGGNISQTGGTVTAPSLIMDAGLDATLPELNSIGNGAPGFISGQSGGDFIVNSQYDLAVQTVSMTRKDGSTVMFSGIDAVKIKLEAAKIILNAALNASDIVALDSDDGVTQTTNGIVTAAGILLTGNGDFFLTQANAIGSLLDPGEFAAAVAGSISIENLYGLVVASLVCGSSTYVGVNVGSGGGMYTGDLTVDTSANDGDFSQQSDANIVVEGQTRINAGNGNVCLGEGDTDADTVTNNDFNEVFIENATSVELADINHIVINEAEVSDMISIESGGEIILNDDIEVDQARLKAMSGVMQQVNTFISANELILQGAGDFNLTERNRIGSAFNAGRIATDIDGSLDLLNDFDLLFDTIDYNLKSGGVVTVSGVTIDAGASTGNLTITTSQDDIGQTDIGPAIVAGLASFDVGVGCISLVDSAGNDFNEVKVIAADEAEIRDATNDMTLLGSTVDDQLLVVTSVGELTIRETINAGARFFIVSGGGVHQGINSVINAEELIAFGNGDFSFEQENNIANTSGIGLIAVDVDGDFALENGGQTRVSTLGYELKSGTTFEFAGIDVTGDFMIQLPDADFDQDSDSAVVVLGNSEFILGTGCLDLPFGDENSDAANDNDFGSVEIVSASLVDLRDTNGFEIKESVISDRARFESETGTINIDRDLRAVNQILFVAGDGMTQSLGTNIDTPEVLFYGSGDFVLDQLNNFGTSGVGGRVAAMIDGSLEIKNDFGITVANLSYTNKDDSTLDIVGVNTDNSTGSGDLTFDINNSSVTQDDDAPVIATGLTTFDVGTTGTVNLAFGEALDPSDPLDELDTNENDFYQIAVDNGDTVEVNDSNSVMVVGAFTNNRLSITSDTADIILDGNINVANIVKFDAQTGLAQMGGVIDSQSLMVMGIGYFDFGQLNDLGNGFPGIFAADVNGDINLVNSNAVQISSLGYNDLEGNAFTAVGVGSSGFGGINNFRLRADGIEVLQRTEADTLVFESTSGITQQDTQTTDGIIDANDFSISGAGFINLTEDNLIGSNSSAGDVTIDWAGDLRLKSLFAIDFDAVTFTFKSGATRTDTDVDIVGLGGLQGNIELTTGGHITDSSNTDISVVGIASFVANNGNSEVIIGDHFSNIGGPNNETHFGSVGFLASNGWIQEDSDMHLDGVRLTGDLNATAYGSIVQTGNDPFSAVGTSAIEVQGAANFIVDSDTLPVDHFNDTEGRDVMLLSRDDDDLINNLFAGPVTIAGTLNAGGFNGGGTLRNVQYRNAAFEVSAFPMIEQFADPLRSLTIWTPESSSFISQDLDILGNFTIYAGVDSVNGKVGGSLDVTNALLNRKITDALGTDMSVGGNAVFEAGNTIILSDDSTDSLLVGGKLQASTHGGDAGSRIRVGVANGGNRGTDSGATVTADQLRFRAKPTALADSEHASFNIDSPVEITGPNVARSLMLIVDGNITDDSDADINVKNSTTLVAEGNADILLGESFSTNFIDNNVHNFGTLSVKAGNADITEDSAILLDGINVTGNFSITAMGHIRQSGQDRFGQIGTNVIMVGGDATFRVDQQQLANDQLNDQIGQDVKILATPQNRLMNNVIEGDVIVESTAFSGTQNGKGSVRNVEIRNMSANAEQPIINVVGNDVVRNLQLWVPNTGLQLTRDVAVKNNFNINVGIDAVNGLRNGRLSIVNNSVVRSLTDSVGVNLMVENNLDFRVANRIKLADNADDSIQVDNKSTFITLGGSQGNGINVGTDTSGPRGNDSGAIFETDTLKYRAPTMGNFGNVTIVGDKPMNVTADSVAKSAVIIP